MKPPVDDPRMVDLLEELAESLGLSIRYEPIRLDEELGNRPGGVCLLKGQRLMIIDPHANLKEKIRILSEGIKQCDLDRVYIRPALRELLDRLPGPKGSGMMADADKPIEATLRDAGEKT